MGARVLDIVNSRFSGWAALVAHGFDDALAAVHHHDRCVIPRVDAGIKIIQICAPKAGEFVQTPVNPGLLAPVPA
jgi:hypothetical protein